MMFSSLAIAGTLMASTAFAQTTTPAQTTPADAAPAQTTPATPDQGTTGAGTAAATTSASSFTDTEVKQYAMAALAVNKINADTTIPTAEKNTKFVAAITASGLQPQRFNEISQAMASDTALNQRIQAAAAQAQTSGQSAQASTPATPTGGN
ncbi:DUF4168 domain-containing protein [Sphingomonas sp. TDK1]|uniref:DUF4168 domain-containing protein n=1 Tax=Sphingomonas sp. TDK1 TaxID=453247 RepID=UPI0007D9A98B|nr:DUF4168 domain-containing protein [Sphingomonas sp. TDK1]OAN66459.1 hypothetical protein A7X12_13125 [Sphingomonas sp. TDK1]